jgi:hypothetical protein
VLADKSSSHAITNSGRVKRLKNNLAHFQDHFGNFIMKSYKDHSN